MAKKRTTAVEDPGGATDAPTETVDVVEEESAEEQEEGGIFWLLKGRAKLIFQPAEYG
jgi:hypothetical protein